MHSMRIAKINQPDRETISLFSVLYLNFESEKTKMGFKGPKVQILSPRPNSKTMKGTCIAGAFLLYGGMVTVS
jgi:hypothetical protein